MQICIYFKYFTKKKADKKQNNSNSFVGHREVIIFRKIHSCDMSLVDMTIKMTIEYE